jgi:ABC-type transport system involved in multi-copper enzyme maturation permease subunit
VNVLTIYRLTLLEALRRRLFWALAVLTLVVVVLSGLGFWAIVINSPPDRVPPLILLAGISQVLILTAFMFSFVLAMTAAFLGSPTISADIESGVLLAIVARPISRAEVLVGKWLGLSTIVLAYAVVAGLLEIAVTNGVTGYGPPDPLSATLYLGGQAIVLLTVAILLSTRLPAIAGGAVAVVLFGLSWMSGVLANFASVLGLDSVATTLQAARYVLPLDGLWHGTVFALEPQAILLAAAGTERATRIVTNSPFYSASGPPSAYLGYVAIWLVVVLALAAWSFGRREI